MPISKANVMEETIITAMVTRSEAQSTAERSNPRINQAPISPMANVAMALSQWIPALAKYTISRLAGDRNIIDRMP